MVNSKIYQKRDSYQKKNKKNRLIGILGLKVFIGPKF